MNDPMKMTMVKTRMMAPMASSVRSVLAKRKLQGSPSQFVARMEQLDEMERLLEFSIKLSSMLSILSIELSIPVSRLFSSDSSADALSSPSKDSSCPPNDPSPSEILSLASLASLANTAGEGSFKDILSVELPEKQLLSKGGFRITMLSTRGLRMASRKERGFEEVRWADSV